MAAIADQCVLVGGVVLLSEHNKAAGEIAVLTFVQPSGLGSSSVYQALLKGENKGKKLEK